MRVMGLAPKSVHPVDIHTGTCRQPGAIKYGLASLVANVVGDASSTSTVEHVKGGLGQADWSVAIHNGASGQPGTQNFTKFPVRTYKVVEGKYREVRAPS